MLNKYRWNELGKQKLDQKNALRVVYIIFHTIYLGFFIYTWVHVKSLQLCLTLCNSLACVARQAPLSMGLSRQEY